MTRKLHCNKRQYLKMIRKLYEYDFPKYLSHFGKLTNREWKYLDKNWFRDDIVFTRKMYWEYQESDNFKKTKNRRENIANKHYEKADTDIFMSNFRCAF